MMDANMPEMAENPKQEETPESIITNEPQMVEEIGEPDLAGNASKDILDILGSDGLDNIGDLLEGKTGETGADIDDYASSRMKVHETADAAVDAQDTEKKSLLKRIISFLQKSRSQMMSQIYRAQQKVQKLTQRHSQMRISRYLKRWMLTES